MRRIRLILLSLGLAGWAQGEGNQSTQSQVPALLKQYCFDCHGQGKSKGDVTFDGWPKPEDMLADHAVWKRVQQMVFTHQMPPKNKPQLTEAERTSLLQWIDSAIFHVDCTHPDPGRVTLRRLNRTEYNNSIRDLLGVDLQPADDFPVDDSGYGFDNIGDALSMPPVLLEKYLASAQRVLGAALGLHRPAGKETKRYSVDLLEVGYNAKQRGDGWVALNSIEEDDVALAVEVPCAARYTLRFRAYARQETTNRLQATFMLDQRPIAEVSVGTNSQAPQIYETSLSTPPGRHRFRVVVRRNKDGLSPAEALRWKSGPEQKGAVVLEWLELEGPAYDTEHPATYARIFPRHPLPATEPLANEETVRILQPFAERAYRRLLSADELGRLCGLATKARTQGNAFEESIETALLAVLVSPHFLFRGELQPEPDNPKSVHPIELFALASRLSYFLWSTLPDDTLMEEARRGTLRDNLDRQVTRMLADPKSRALVDNFAGQWLQFRNLEVVTPDRQRFKAFDESLRQAMRRETELLFETILRENRSVLEFLNADYTFVDETLARLYGIPGIPGGEFHRVSLQGTHRRGVLTHASVLTLTSNPTRTSPVKRGKWVLENLFNAPPPPPPPGVPELSESKEAIQSGSLRQRMERHRENPLCASCHTRMDAIGFGLENFDPIGGWRDKDSGFPIEAAGSIVDGESFENVDELLSLLAEAKGDAFIRCLAEKLLTYALGRGLDTYDKCAIDQICQSLKANDHRFSTLILEIARSVPFQMRRGEDGGTRAK